MSAILLLLRRLGVSGPPGEPPGGGDALGQWDFSDANQSGHYLTAGF